MAAAIATTYVKVNLFVSVAVEWLALLSGIQDVPETDYPDRVDYFGFHHSAKKFRASNCKRKTTTYFPFVISNSLFVILPYYTKVWSKKRP